MKLFRKIRRVLLDNNKIRKYILYAFGEIILVVLGILIALQFNTWKIENNTKKTEIEILKNIAQNIQMDTLDMNGNINWYKERLKNDSTLLSHLIQKKAYDDSVGRQIKIQIINDVWLVLHTSAFEEAKQRGLSIISNKKLRNKISRLYEFEYKYLLETENQQPTFNHHKLLNEALEKYVELKPEGNWYNKSNATYISKENYERLLNDKNAHHKISVSLIFLKNILNSYYNPSKDLAQDVYEDIKKELKVLESNI